MPKITTFKEAIIALEDVQTFFESHGHSSTSMTYIRPAIDAIASVKDNSLRQSSILHYLFHYVVLSYT